MLSCLLPWPVVATVAADLCRSINFGYVGPGEYLGIEGLKFGLPKAAFATPEQNPQNECFCMFQGKKREMRCSISGAYDLGGCQAGAPLIITRPHFIETQPDLSKNVDGLAPNLEEHDTYLIIEPVCLFLLLSVTHAY